jgi:hypothetical protein
MQHSLSGLNVSDTIEGFLQAKLAEGRSAQLRKGCRVFCGTGAGPAHE